MYDYFTNIDTVMSMTSLLAQLAPITELDIWYLLLVTEKWQIFDTKFRRGNS